MSLSRTDAKIYIAQAAGEGEARLGMAGNSLLAAFETFNLARDWSFTLMETTFNTASGTSDYTLPVTIGGTPGVFKRPHSLTDATFTRNGVYIDPREFDLKALGVANNKLQAYTVYLPTIFTQPAQPSTTEAPRKVRLYPTPAGTYAMTLKYYRKMNPGSDPLDILDAYQWALLDWATAHFITRLSPTDPRIGQLWQNANAALSMAMALDERTEEATDLKKLSRFEAGLLGSSTAPTG